MGTSTSVIVAIILDKILTKFLEKDLVLRMR